MWGRLPVCWELRWNKHKETFTFLLLLILGIGPRLALIARFPTIPVSDFNSIVRFGLHLRTGLAFHDLPGFWQNFNVGLPLILCGFFRAFPNADPNSLARIATACADGLLPLLPFWIWRGVLSFRVRVLGGAALAVWVGQIIYSGVVAQENWAILPVVAMGALAVRALIDPKRAWPVAAGLLYVAAVAIRQDMIITLPLLLAAARIDLVRTKWRPALAGGLAAVLGLVGLAAYRYAASGRFALSTEHVGVTLLGAYIPGTSLPGLNGSDGLQSWIPPYPYIAYVRPDLLLDRKTMFSQTMGLTVREALRRPVFHALRIVSMAGYYAIHGESDLLYGSLMYPDALPVPIREQGVAFANRLNAPLRLEMFVIQVLFMAALIIGLRLRNAPILTLSLVAVLNYIGHALAVFYGRFFMASTALELMTIVLASREVIRTASPQRRWLWGRPLAAGVAFGLALFFLSPVLLAYVQHQDIDPVQHTYHFVLEPPDHNAALACVMEGGQLTGLWPGLNTATIRPFQRDPAPGDAAVATCRLTGSGKPKPLTLQVFDSYPLGDLPGRMLQRVEMDGAEIYSHDIAATPGTVWANVPLVDVGAETEKKVVIEVRAIKPDPGADWGEAGITTVQIIRPSLTHLAMGKPAAQSSMLADDDTAAARLAVDGNTDGKFFGGSVTSTGRDDHAWWQVDLGASTQIGSIVIWNRTDCCSSRLSDYWVFVSDTPFLATDTPATLQKRAGIWCSHQAHSPDPSIKINTPGIAGRYVRVQLSGTDYLSLAEVQVFGP